MLHDKISITILPSPRAIITTDALDAEIDDRS